MSVKERIQVFQLNLLSLKRLVGSSESRGESDQVDNEAAKTIDKHESLEVLREKAKKSTDPEYQFDFAKHLIKLASCESFFWFL